jgi:hypothetical protein
MTNMKARAITGALLTAVLFVLSFGGALCGASCVSGSMSNASASGMPAGHACCPAASTDKDRSGVTSPDACSQSAGDAIATVATTVDAAVVLTPAMVVFASLPAPVQDAVSISSVRPLVAAASPPVVPLRI